jgi:hypothetical protein
MTTPWTPAGEWAGQTVAVLASGPSMSAEVAQALREHRTIAVNYTHRLAPWADMLVGMDGNWPREWREFAGWRVCGIEDDTLDAFYVGHMSERVTLAAGHTIDFRNSGLAAIRIAARMGASRIILAGFEPENPRRWHDDEVDSGELVGVAAGLAQLRAELAAAGVVVEDFQPKRKAKAKPPEPDGALDG